MYNYSKKWAQSGIVKRDGLCDDVSRNVCGGRPRSYTGQKPERRMILSGGENYRPASRFMRLIKDYKVKQKPSYTDIVACDICKGPMKVLFRPSEKQTRVCRIEDAWEESGPVRSILESNQVQRLFDEWWRGIISRQEPEKKTSSRTCLELMYAPEESRYKPHHYRHHIEKESSMDVISSAAASVSIVRPMQGKRSVQQLIWVVCSHCEDPYRPWVRSSEKTHLYSPTEVTLPHRAGGDLQEERPGSQLQDVVSRRKFTMAPEEAGDDMKDQILKYLLQDSDNSTD